MAILLAGCFNTRTPEPPSQNAPNSQWIPPTDYNILLQNFKNSISQLNTQNYLRCIADTFEFIPTQVRDNSDYLIFQKWTKNDEKTYFENLNAKSLPLSPHNLQFKNVEHQFVGSNTVKYNADYHLEVQHNDSTLTKTFRGQVNLTLHRNHEGLWHILKWQDIEKAKDSSWTLLKIRFIR
ncbi:MAG: hypothetical protein NZ455_14720 [Bacteroidia bacterium]|nr:hypothetical protein [Bacteroidia bacterium]MDW8346716.1 hypothetical protein [Bacteroidia bacterium]